jgi:type 1 glutamine amidotransferase
MTSFTRGLACAGLLLATSVLAAAPGRLDGPRRIRALVYHETTGFRHPSIPYAIQQFTRYGRRLGIQMIADQTSQRFTDEGLAPFDVVVWLNTVGGINGSPPLLTDDEWAAFERYIQAGGGYAGIHGASDCCEESAWYGDLLGNGARFNGHPSGIEGSPGCLGAFPGAAGGTGSCFQAVVINEDARHPTTRHLPARWSVSDELYNFRASPRGAVRVLQSLDESSYDFQPHPFIRAWGALMGEDHPITWCHQYDGGRVWYTGLGHDAAAYADGESLFMILKGIRWAAGPHVRRR